MNHLSVWTRSASSRCLIKWMQKREGASILMSTHILSTAERYCDRIILLHEGRVRAQGTMDDLRASFRMPNATLDDLYIEMTKEQAGE